MALPVSMKTTTLATESDIPSSLKVQDSWAETAVRRRLYVLRRLRQMLTETERDLLDAFSPRLNRTRADSLASELLPLLDACRFLERDAVNILKPKNLGGKGRPFWLSGLETRIERVPHGTVLVIGPANYPLLLAGVQVLQALVAGNAVVWKPGRGGEPLARMFAATASRAGLPDGLLRVTDDSVEAGILELERHPDKVCFTGSFTVGLKVIRRCAELVIPAVAELSGCDAVIVLPGADTSLVASALEFGMRLNGSSTCMAPRRLLLVGQDHDVLLGELSERFARMQSIEIAPEARLQLDLMLDDARQLGGRVVGDTGKLCINPLLVLSGTPTMALAHSDLGLPVLTVLQTSGIEDLLHMHSACEFTLTAAIFGNPVEAEALGSRLKAGTILINDLIVPTADPRVPFGGRGASGFGLTRGAEGLLEMTAVKVVAVRKGSSRRHFAATTTEHEILFRGVIEMSHGKTWATRWAGLRHMFAASRKLK